MKTLYSILGLAADASAQQIEAAYAAALEEMQQGRFAGDPQVRLVAIREAYSTLKDPVRRKLYDQKLFAPETPLVIIEEHSFWNLKTVLVFGVIVLAAIALYTYQMRERERVRIESAKEVANKALKLVEEQQKQQADEQLRREDRLQQATQNAQERQQEYARERALREADYRMRQNQREEEMQSRRESYAREQQERNRQYDAQRQLARDKQQLQRMEYENYGKVLSR